RELGYPPYSRLVRILFQGSKESAVRAAAATWDRKLAEALPPMLVSKLGPAPAPFFRVKNRYRIHILLKAQDLEPVRQAIRSILDKYRPSRSLQVVVDVDPISMV
ncbi:MAG TPA: primosomal protein N', partial [Planctomycetota bacterium]|nr:primosomal protein N' [Planctomycetota bacterium]